MGRLYTPVSTKLDMTSFVSVLREKKGSLSSNDGVDLCKMPPCSQVLSLHILRANYQVLIWRNSVFQNPSIPKPEGNGWQRNDTNELEVQWYKNDFIPDELNKIVCDEMYICVLLL